MGSSDWQRLQEVFAEALSRPASKRAAYLDAACEPELRQRVEELLVVADEGTRVIEGAIGEAASEVVATAIGPGSTIGPYRLRRELGRGGMGSVFLAERADEEFEQRVALKVVGAGALSATVLERFLAERRILAGLEHPLIARLFDGGRTEDGLPYFVMEYVEGVPIDVYCDRERLTTRQRLELFRQVCAAVAFAHRKLVVHRDIKPSNILVTSDGTPKLLDFGIAKLLETEPAAGAATVGGERAMTPEYASPEQVRGEPVSTATDVYALGLLLYELLSGRKAHRLPSSRPADVERVVCAEAPDKPSTAVGAEPGEVSSSPSPASAADIGRSRRSTPARLRKTLRGDLDNIVMMALRKEPERRYASADQLSEDLRRYLGGLPVLAHADSVGYRLGKFARRHAALLAAAAGVLLLVAGLVAFYTARLAGERDRARLEADRANRTAEFLGSLFEPADPDLASGEQVTAEELLAAGADRIRSDAALSPETRGAMLVLIGDIHRKLALFDRARELLEEAVEVQQEVHGERSAETGAAVFALARTVFDSGDPGNAMPEFERALAIRREVHGEDSLEVARVLDQMAVAAMNSGRSADGEPMARRALAIMQAAWGPEDPRTADAVHTLGTMAWFRGDFGEAESRYREALALREKGLGPKHRKVGDALQSLAVALMLQRREAEALPYYQRAGEIFRQMLGEGHPSYAGVLEGMAVLHRRRGDLAAAEETYRRVLAIYRAPEGGNRLAEAITRGNMGWVARLRKRSDEAIEHGLASLDLVADLENPGTVAWLSQTLGASYLAAGELGRAAELLGRAIRLREEGRGDRHPGLVPPLVDLAEVRRRQGRRPEAHEKLERALAILEGGDDPDQLQLAQVNARLGELLAEEGRCERASGLLTAAIPLLASNAAQAADDLPRAEAASARCAGT